MAQAPPQYSVDHQWWWNGTRWLPAASAPPTAPRKGRTWFVTAAIVVVVFVASSWAAWTAYMAFARTFSIHTTLAATRQTVVGSTSSFTVTVTNTSGSDIKNFVIYVHPEGREDWFKHHAVADSGACVAAPDRGRFECGPIASGSTTTFTIQGTPTDAGTFNYALNYGDDRGGGDIASARGMWQEWTETVSP